MANIRCTTWKDGSMSHTLQVGDRIHVLGVVRTAEQARRCSRVNIFHSRSPSAIRDGVGG